MKKILSILMCLSILISTLTIIQTSVSAKNTYKSGDYSYEYDGDYNNVIIVYYSGTATNLVIPSVLDGKKVTSIGDDAFRWCKSLTSVTIPNSVTSIGNYAFYNCTKLTSISIPNSVTSIGWEVFYDCTSLTSITIGNSDIYIDLQDFYNTAYYNNPANWDGSVFYVDNILISASKYSADLDKCVYNIPKNYSIRQGTRAIKGGAFSGCTSLTSITIPNSVTSIGDYAFHDCTSLTNVIIPNSVKSIGDYAFSNCTSLTSISIPNSVTSIGDYAFEDCKNLIIKTSCKNRNKSIFGYSDYVKYIHESTGKLVVVKKPNCFTKGKKVIRCKNCKKILSTKYYGKKIKFKSKPSIKKVSIKKKYAGNGLVWIFVKNHVEYRRENKYEVTLKCKIKKPKYTYKVEYDLYRKYGNKWIYEDTSGKGKNNIITYEIENNKTVQYKIKAIIYDGNGHKIKTKFSKVYKVKIK